MRIDRIRSKGIGCDREVDVDLASIPGTLLAVTGPNGSGKTIFVESIAAAIDRTTPTRGSLVELAKLSGDRQAYLEVAVTNGKPWLIRHDIDGVSGKSKATVKDAAGADVLDDTKVETFEAWSARTFDPPEVRFASTFCPQKSDGFLDMKPSERRAVVLRVCGAEALEAKATRARKLANEARGRVDVLSARIKDLAHDPSYQSVGDLERDLAEAREALTRVTEDLEAAKARLAAVEAEAEVARAAHAAEQERLRKLGEAEGRLKAAKARIADLDSRIANNADVLSRADEIRAAAAKALELDDAIAGRTARIAGLEQDVKAAEARLSTAIAAGKEASARADAAARRVESVKARLADRERIEAAAGWVKETQADIGVVTSAAAKAESEIERLQALSTGVAERRIGALRGALSHVAENEGHWQNHASRAIVADDAMAKEAAEAPADLRTHRDTLRGLRLRLDTLRTKLAHEQNLAALAPGLKAAEADLEAATEEHRVAEESATRAVDKDMVDAQLGKRHAGTALAAARSELESDRKALDALGPLLKQVDPLTKAEARLAELEPQRDALNLEAMTVAIEVVELKNAAQELPAMPDVAGATETRLAAFRAEGDAGHRVTSLEQALEKAVAAEEKLSGLRAELDLEQEAVSDWTRLASDYVLLQQLEADAAGPTLTEYANDLLHSTVGPRWTVSIETQRASADGKRMIEGFDVRVIDGESGRDVLGDRLSGGETAIVGEAVSLAISMMACRGMTDVTLVRDETSAALDPEASRAYVAMLRKAAKHVNAGKVLFVSHNPEMQDLADARIEVSDGRVTVAA